MYGFVCYPLYYRATLGGTPVPLTEEALTVAGMEVMEISLLSPLALEVRHVWPQSCPLCR